MLFKTLGKTVEVKNSYPIKEILVCFFDLVLLKICTLLLQNLADPMMKLTFLYYLNK